MQLILNSETDLTIQRKMAAIEQESFDEKFSDDLSDEFNNKIANIKKEYIENSITVISNNKNNMETDESLKDGDKVSEDDLSDKSINKIDHNAPSDDNVRSSKECIKAIKAIAELVENGDSETVEKIVDDVENQSGDCCVTEVKLKDDEPECVEINEEKQDCAHNEIDNNIQKIEINNDQKTEVQENTIKAEKKIESKTVSNEDIVTECVENDEVIDIADDIKEDQEQIDIENNTESINTGNTNDIDSNKKEQNVDFESSSKKTILENTEPHGGASQETVHKLETTSEISNDGNKDSKKYSLVCKLSNTLDILSDDEEESVKEESSIKLPSVETPLNDVASKPLDDKPSDGELQKEKLSSVEKQSIYTEDDDVIMLIDEDPSPKDKNDIENTVETNKEEKVCHTIQQTNSMEEPVEKEIVLEPNKDETKTEESILNKEVQEEETSEKQSVPKPLLPFNFLKTCKKNFADMTREELEEFCILKIVESVVDRSNLNEIKTQLNTMSQNIEEYKKKALLISKQNRDLQVVVKSVQEEQKKRSDLPITPLKITRSVGMQVFMSDKTVAQKKSSVGPNIGNNRQNKSQTNQTPKTQKVQTTPNTNQIPVPRLVPAVNNSINSKQSPVPNSPAKTLVTPTTPNGFRSSPPMKAEKRPHSRLQQGNNVMVDLTDDEPPTKVLQRNMNPPVRLVPPQNLMAPQRQQFGTAVNSPRKVYIPISGSQNQVRPAQAIMLKPVMPSSGPRQRVQNILPKPNLNVRTSRVTNRHPAPLPDCIKQYQPPNWKALPPAPELNLSKVENGIVISWKIDEYHEDNHEEIASYQLYAYQETSSPASTSLWKKIGDVKALPLPMACTLTQFMSGYKYYFAVRAVDIRSRLGPFSAPGNILLLKKL